MKDLKGKVAVITGCGRGIGLCLAKALQSHGVIVYGIDKEFANDTGIENPVCIDLLNHSDIANLKSRIEERHGALNILINNAGVTIPSSDENYKYDDWIRTLKINLDAPFVITQQLLSLLKKGRGSSIINITSLNSALAFPNNPAYVASKSGLAGLTRSMALDYGKHGIRVNSISPGYIKTEMTGESWSNITKRKERQNRTVLGRWGTPEDLSGPMLFLCSDMSSYITGHSLFVDGGWKIRGL